MKHPIIILLTVLVPSSVFANPPDLCSEALYVNEKNQPLSDSQGTTLSRYCQWTGPGAPVWAGGVCCSIDAVGASCMTPDDRSGCLDGLDLYHCEHGEEVLGGVVCYQEFPSACEAGFCSESGSPPSYDAPEGFTEDAICCIGGTCWEWDDLNYEDCGGVYIWCDDGYSNVDGTVECFD